jgi:hypothetical protein
MPDDAKRTDFETLARLADGPPESTPGAARPQQSSRATAAVFTGNAASETEQPRQRGFWARVFGNNRAPDSDPTAEPGPTLAALPAADALDEDGPTAPGQGLFARLFGGGDRRPEGTQARDPRDPSAGDALPFGAMGRACGLDRSALGSRIAWYPQDGQAVYTLYDTDPGSEDTRTFHITGFEDGCARQVTAALALFGEIETYEVLRYGPTGDALPLGATDTAYDRIKRRVCGVGRRQPCGDARAMLARDTVFVSVYPRFGSNPDWQTLLLHAGDVAALDVKSP